MTKRTNVVGMKYCGDCSCFDATKKRCRCYDNPADENNTACIARGGKIERDYDILPSVDKCSECKKPCEKTVMSL